MNLPQPKFNFYATYNINNGDTEHIFRFPNGLGAKVTQYDYSYGLMRGIWQFAVIKFNEIDNEMQWGDTWDIIINNEISNNIKSYLSWESVEENLEKLKSLEVLGND